MTLRDDDFDFVRQLFRKHTGNELAEDKQYLVESRLKPIVRANGMTSTAELVDELRSERVSREIVAQVCDVLLTKETSFFRDESQFNYLRKMAIPKMVERQSRERCLRIWCAACSTGQEPYSIAMLLDRHFPNIWNNWRVELIASDISHDVLDRAQQATYNDIEADRGLTQADKESYFDKVESGWRLSERIRKQVEFRQMNLVASWPSLPQFDLIFMRNVLIYFDDNEKRMVLARARQSLNPNGLLLLGATETTHFIDDEFQRIDSHAVSVYSVTRLDRP